jgi:hypothetical protein
MIDLSTISPVATILCSNCGWDLSDDSSLAECCKQDISFLEAQYTEGMADLL